MKQHCHFDERFLRGEISVFKRRDFSPPRRSSPLGSGLRNDIVMVLGMTLIVCVLCSGCIRLTGGAGLWHQGPNDETPKTKQVHFDTHDYVPGTPAPGTVRNDS